MPDGLPLVRRFNALMAEKDLQVATDGGWFTATDPDWRADWRARLEALLEEIRAQSA